MKAFFQDFREGWEEGRRKREMMMRRKKETAPQSTETTRPAAAIPSKYHAKTENPKYCIAKRQPSCRVCFDLPLCTSTLKKEGCPHSIEIPLLQLRDSAWNTDCQICYVLFAALRPFVEEEDESRLQSVDLLAYEGLIQTLYDNTQRLLVIPREYETDPITRISKHNRGKKRQCEKKGIYAADLYASGKSRREWFYSRLEGRMQVQQDPNSAASHLMVRNWLSGCLQNHDWCKRSLASRPNFAPDRLIHIESSSVIRLSTTHPITTPYVALSYCWGARTIFSTTKENISNHFIGIPWDMIPPTFRQAVGITLALGLRYIWIDALCIIQKDAEDFANQSRKMGEVYSNAVVVVSAASGHTVQEGFLDERDYGSVEIRIPPWKRACHEMKGNDDLSLLLARPIFTDTLSETGYQIIPQETLAHYSFHSDPIYNRAWCFQERCLATRVVHFSTNEMYWECGTQTLCECGLEEMEKKNPARVHLLARYYGDSQNQRGLQNQEFWWESVAEFSQRELTVVTDRLSAISGLARRMQCDELGAYCAGLWTGDLPTSLLWTTRSLVGIYGNWVPETYVGPTWSWVSMMGPVWPPSSDGFGKEVAKVQQISCQPSSNDEFGPISSASIVITGPTKVDVIETSTVEAFDTGASDVRFVSEEVDERHVNQSNRAGLKLHVDMPYGTLTSHLGEALCIIIAYNQRFRGWEGLALTKSEKEEGSYERVGYIEYYGELGEEWEEKTVRII